ncbi:MAG: helix-turn-helix transcriptional regulator [Clostridia bacterium]|nr:helix-turn-helix transcriptional regulator [Clostridia bacterium]MBR0215312.1 helix-turn-helix transcriptional regulator [Clostridia bacterium]
MEKDFSRREPEKPIDRIYVEDQVRDRSYIVPTNHYHPYYEIYYLESGSCRFFIGGTMLDVHAGDLLIIPPRTMHYTRYLFGTCRRFNLFFRRKDLEQDIRNTFPGQDTFFSQWRLLQIPDFYRDSLTALFGRMLNEEKINDERTPLLLKCRLQETLLVCSRIGVIPEAPPADIHTTDQAIVRAAGFMREHFREPITAEEIAKAAGFSINYLSRKFRQAAGLGVHEYLSYLRLHQAALELVETKDLIIDIALRCGFTDANYFKDCFKRHYGVSPRAYRTGKE